MIATAHIAALWRPTVRCWLRTADESIVQEVLGTCLSIVSLPSGESGTTNSIERVGFPIKTKATAYRSSFILKRYD